MLAKKEKQIIRANVSNRHADSVINHMYSTLDQDVAIIGNSRVRIWHALLLGMFLTGSVSAMFWATDYFSSTRAQTVSQADLVPDAIWWSPHPVSAGNQVAISFRVKNTGSVAAGGSHVQLYRDETPVCGWNVGTLNAGQTFEQTCPPEFGINPAQGNRSYVMRLAVDDRSQVAELNEGNNSKEALVPVDEAFPTIFPDLVVGDIWPSPAVVLTGNNVSLNFRVRNIGSPMAGHSHVQLYRDGVPVCGVDVPALSAGQIFEYTCPPGSGIGQAQSNRSYVIRAVADDKSQVAERMESNNVREESIPVGGSTDGPHQCGNTICDPGENTASCSLDCAASCTPGGSCTLNNCPGTYVCQNNQRVCQDVPNDNCPSACTPGGSCTVNNCPGTFVCQNSQRVCQDTPGDNCPSTCTPGGGCTVNNCPGTYICQNNQRVCQDTVGDNCPAPGPVCGNGRCESGENSSNCMSDCHGNPPPTDLTSPYGIYPDCIAPAVGHETHGWWMQNGEDVPRHLHWGICLPNARGDGADGGGVTVSGEMKSVVRVMMFNNPGDLVWLRWGFQGGSGSGSPDISFRPPLKCQNSPDEMKECTWYFPLSINSGDSNINGQDELRMSPNVEHRDLGTRQFITNNFQINNGRGAAHYRTFSSLINRAWYNGVDYTNATWSNYMNLIGSLNETMPTLRGTVSLKVAHAQCDTTTENKSLAFVDSSFHPIQRGESPPPQDCANYSSGNKIPRVSGCQLYEKPGCFSGTVQLDTTKLSNGRHNFYIQTQEHDSRGFNAGAGNYYFMVNNP